jgi:hypothetical protein
VTFTWKVKGISRRGLGMTRDIAVKGLFIQSDILPPTSTVARCSLAVPPFEEDGRESYLVGTALGRVVRTSGEGFAVRTRVFRLESTED